MDELHSLAVEVAQGILSEEEELDDMTRNSRRYRDLVDLAQEILREEQLTLQSSAPLRREISHP